MGEINKKEDFFHQLANLITVISGMIQVAKQQLIQENANQNSAVEKLDRALTCIQKLELLLKEQNGRF